VRPTQPQPQPVDQVKTLGDGQHDSGAQPGGPTYSEMIARQKAQRKQQEQAAEEAARGEEQRRQEPQNPA
jgi:hypothetical protein